MNVVQGYTMLGAENIMKQILITKKHMEINRTGDIIELYQTFMLILL